MEIYRLRPILFRHHRQRHDAGTSVQKTVSENSSQSRRQSVHRLSAYPDFTHHIYRGNDLRREHVRRRIHDIIFGFQAVSRLDLLAGNGLAGDRGGVPCAFIDARRGYRTGKGHRHPRQSGVGGAACALGVVYVFDFSHSCFRRLRRYV